MKRINASKTIEKDLGFLQDTLFGGEKIVYESIVENDMPTRDISLIANISPQITLTILRRLERKGFVEHRRGNRGSIWSKKKN